mgnify:FL=1
MIGYKDQYLYHGTHFWWDEDDNEYILCATWKFEKNYPDMPDYWHLEDLEVEQFNGLYQDNGLDVRNGTPVWCDVERDGCPIADLQEVDYS